ncbi:hypothetical protein [Rouxiella sp. WC2420]|uniref:Uncharacterized protein n=1 Tax=Rouxiella sp. WC2420 TaxID=3234145 RepID=A0AB39VMS1_9GAMM
MAASTCVIAGLALAADVASIASASLEDQHPQASAILGWTSMALGVVSLGMSTAAAVQGFRSALKTRALASSVADVGASRQAGVGVAHAEPRLAFSVPGQQPQSLRSLAMAAATDDSRIRAKISLGTGELPTSLAKEAVFRRLGNLVNYHLSGGNHIDDIQDCFIQLLKSFTNKANGYQRKMVVENFERIYQAKFPEPRLNTFLLHFFQNNTV